MNIQRGHRLNSLPFALDGRNHNEHTSGPSAAPKQMMISTKLVRLFTGAALALAIALPASGQVPGAPQQPDQVDQLTQLLGLSEDQQTKIRAVFDEISPKLEKLQLENVNLQQKLREQTGPDFDESEIRKTAAKLGEISGEMTALSAILQSKVEANFTEEQRQKLEDLQQQQQRPPQAQPQPQPEPQQSQGDGETDQHGRPADHSHHGHNHP